MVRLNKILLISELTLIVLPTTLLLLIIGMPFGIGQFLDSANISNLTIALITVLSLGATFSVWKITIMHLKSYVVLNRKLLLYWISMLGGVGISALPIVWSILGPPEPYSSKTWYFYDQLSIFSFGIVLIIPSIHTFISALVYENR